MRDASIETTVHYYVGREAGTTTEMHYDAVAGDTLGNSGAQSTTAHVDESTQAVGA
jgi:hypothetical protein